MINSDSPILHLVCIYHDLEEELDDDIRQIKTLIDMQSFQNEVSHAVDTYITSGKPVRWFDAVMAVNRKIKALLRTDHHSSNKEKQKLQAMLQVILHGRKDEEKDFIKVVIIQHSLLKLLKEDKVRFVHTPCVLHKKGSF